MFWSIVIIGIPSIILCVSILLWDEEMIFEFLGVASGVILLIILLAIPLARMGIKGEIREFKAVQQTIDRQRESRKYPVSKEYENAALTMKIIDSNKWLASEKYYRKLFKVWHPKEIESLQPIK